MHEKKGTWGGSVSWVTAFRSGHDPRTLSRRVSPESGSLLSRELLLPLPLPLVLSCSLPLSNRQTKSKKKKKKMHEKRNTKQKNDGKPPQGAAPAYLVDREGLSQAKVLYNMIKQK